MPEFSYTKVNGISPIPIVTTYFSNLSNPSIITTCDCGILDTGSDLTIVSYTIISKLQATAIDRQQSISFRGLGRSSQGIAYRVGMSFDGAAFFRVKAIAVPDDVLNNEVIIGRNILNRYAIMFDGPNLVFNIF
ncbi:hypothetical protein [Chamaesiphon sp. OTE_20_metabat_361]|uniref:hypothetical protein n=1 Tax=Chamaesiphon sp. OTE_20_metabat_361 TaxID=2964689 RepID=UPI00286A2D7D|nr:hypothetical protein [Chamaesiphon sp. OTE_20_metabat_361]